jgi:uncharacterized protein YndB with AHSA1/START domain
MITLKHAVKIAAPRDVVFRAFTEIAELANWHLGTIDGEVEAGKTFHLERRPDLRFRWRTDRIDAGNKIVQTCVDGPGFSRGKTLTIDFSDEPDARTLIQLNDSGWHEQDKHLPLCNTHWGEALGRLRDYLESKRF